MLLTLAAFLSFLAPFSVQDAPVSVRDPEAPNPAPIAAPADAEQLAREAAFAQRLSGADLVGYTTLTGGDGKLTSEELQKDSYRLTQVSKNADGKWKFQASMSYGGMKLPIAVSLPVEWAGDTPVISVTDMKVAMMGTYSARVVFYGDQYVGVWSGDGYGGHIFGQVVRPQEAQEAGAAAPIGAGDVDPKSVHWPSFRGKGGSGVALGFETIDSFDAATGENVLWKAEIPGLAHSCPAIWGDKVFLTTAVRLEGDAELALGWSGGSTAPVEDEGEVRYEVHCLDKRTGELLWKRDVWSGLPAIMRHPKGSHAAPTPACDGERVVAFFGSEGLFAFDHDGKQLWKRDFGILDSGFYLIKTHQWGFSSSPVIHGDRVIVQCDVQGQSFLAMLDAATGEDIWRTNREDEPGWSTPTVHIDGERSQIICNGWKEIAGYELATGKRLWTAEPGGDLPVPTPVCAFGHTFITNSHGRYSPIYAIDLKALGHVVPSKEGETNGFMTWSELRRGSYMPTPIVVGEHLYVCRDNGVLSCYDARTGEQHYSERLDEGQAVFTASPVATGDRLYCFAEDGTVFTVRTGTTFEVIARSALGEDVLASPALSEGVLYVRSRGSLFAIGK